jgi:GDP/UDP-N,N'-diacetylbacillosamine 2-epimerase (hydrolysing)
MNHADVMLGNTSSGIIEAASFGKYVINIGDRQKGRVSGENVINVSYNAEEIINSLNRINGHRFEGKNIYYQDDTVKKIIKQLGGL